jgi:F0F1-type ATP synthase assembly protein I
VDEPKGGLESDRSPRKPLSSGAEFAGVGLQLGGTIALSAWLGYWLDRKFGTLPWMTIVFVFFGAGTAFYAIYRRVIGGPKR